MANYNSSYTGAQLDATIAKYLTLEGDGGAASKNWTNTQFNNYVLKTDANSTYCTKANPTITGTLTHSGEVYRNLGNVLPVLENVAYYNSDDASVTGALKITLPSTSGMCVMQMMEVWIYDYSSRAGAVLFISGYTYADNKWYNYNCTTIGKENIAYTAYFAYDGTHHCVYLGNTSYTWSYPKVWLKTWMGGFSDKYNWINAGRPTISIITSTSGYTVTGSSINGLHR